jgi:plasmid stability protein
MMLHLLEVQAMHTMTAQGPALSAGDTMAMLTIRGLDEGLKSRLRLEAARRGCSMEETVRQILWETLTPDERDGRGLASRAHGYFVEVGEFDLEIPSRELPGPPLDFSEW